MEVAPRYKLFVNCLQCLHFSYCLHCLNCLHCCPVHTVSTIQTRAGKSKSLIQRKRRKGGKSREKAEKADLVMQLAFWQKCQNAIKWQNACTSGQGPASEYFFLNAYNFGTRGPTKVRRISKWPPEQGLSNIHLKHQKQLLLCKADKGDLRRLARPPLK